MSMSTDVNLEEFIMAKDELSGINMYTRLHVVGHMCP